MASIDYYEVLGVSRDATPEEIKRAFRRKARETHPDVASGEDAEERFKLINEAYEVLSDAEKRANYDRFGTPEPRMGGYGGTYADFGDLFGVGDIFETFFGGMGGFGSQQRVRAEGRDLRVRITVTLLEAAEGVVKEVPVTRIGPCASCQATGAAPGGSAKRCGACGGTGQRRAVRRTLIGVMETLTPCDSCQATGTIVDPPCPVCRGTGQARVTETVRVEVPAGIADGQTIRVRGQGEAGLRGARAGDLLVVVHVAPHEYIHRDGDDLHMMAAIDMAQAALGDTIVVSGLFGDEEVSFGPGVQSGEAVRLRGRGMPSPSGGRGDLIVHLRVEIPRRLTKRQRELLRELKETFGSAVKRPTPLERIRDWLGA